MPGEKIVSLRNERIKAAAALKTASGRRESGRFLLEGPKLIAEALEAGYVLDEVFYCDAAALQRCGALRVQATEVSDEVLSRMSDTVTPQGVVAVAQRRERDALRLHSGGRYVLLEQVQNAGNVGNILRTAEALGMDGALFCGDAVDLFSPKVLRGSMGSALRLPTAHYDSALQAAQALHGAGLALWGAALREDAQMLLSAGELQGAVAIGNEGRGLSGEMLDVCDKLVVIPMRGQTESLSAPCAAAILLWELWGRRDAGCGQEGTDIGQFETSKMT